MRHICNAIGYTTKSTAASTFDTTTTTTTPKMTTVTKKRLNKTTKPKSINLLNSIYAV